MHHFLTPSAARSSGKHVFALERARPARGGRQATPGTPPSTETFLKCVVSCVEARAIDAIPTTVVASSPNKVRQPEAVGLRGPDEPLAMGRASRPRGYGMPLGIPKHQNSARRVRTKP